jgi:hypothetical protein
MGSASAVLTNQAMSINTLSCRVFTHYKVSTRRCITPKACFNTPVRVHRHQGLLTLLSLLLLISPIKTIADNLDLDGSIAFETRLFTQSSRHPGQNDSNVYSLYLQPELRYEAIDWRLNMVPFYRFDNIDDERSHFDIRELSWRFFSNQWEVLIGIDRVFWGVTESRHLVDVINQTDLVENINQESKLGQPMLRLNWMTDWGDISAFVLPIFRERTFPGSDGRLRTALPVSSDDAEYDSNREHKHIDLALRYSNVLGNWDVGAYYFRGTDREPRLLIDDNRQALIPYYALITQLGADVQLTAEAWLWKLETIVRQGQGKTFAAAVGGFEYTWYQISDSSSDLGLILELLYDGRDDSAPPTLLDRDIFLGLRLGLNDIDSSELLFGMFYDLDKQQYLYKLEGSRRLTQHLSVEVEAWIFDDSDSHPIDFSQDDYAQLQLIWHL